MFPPWWNVRQKVAVATPCSLWTLGKFPKMLFDQSGHRWSVVSIFKQLKHTLCMNEHVYFENKCYLFNGHIYTSKEYWMIYRGPGFLSVVWFGSLLTPFPTHQQLVSLSQYFYVSPVELAEGREWTRSQILRPRVNLVFYKSFYSLCIQVNTLKNVTLRPRLPGTF